MRWYAPLKPDLDSSQFSKALQFGVQERGGHVGGTIRVFGTTETVADCLSSQQDRAKPCHWSLAAIQSAQVPNASLTDIAHLGPTTEL